jgi:hypothetical protein
MNSSKLVGTDIEVYLYRFQLLELKNYEIEKDKIPETAYIKIFFWVQIV